MVCMYKAPKNVLNLLGVHTYSSAFSFFHGITIFPLRYVHVGYLHIIIHSGVSKSILCERSSEKSVISMCGRAHLFFDC